MAQSNRNLPSPRSKRVKRSSQQPPPPPPPRFVEFSDHDSEETRSDTSEAVTDALLATSAAFSSPSVAETEDGTEVDNDDDDAYLRKIAEEAVAASQAADEEEPSYSPRKTRGNTMTSKIEALFMLLLDPIKRSDLRRRKYAEFVPFEVRHSLLVPKKVSKSFVKTRAAKFVELFEFYVMTSRVHDIDLEVLRAFEAFLQELMDCFDHPQEVIAWNPFGAFASLVEAGAVVRSPGAVQSCSRLTLGADWGLLTPEDERRIGPTLLVRLHRLHQWRMAEIDETLVRWSGKFRRGSTCKVCNTDPWELFLLTTLVGMKKEGTRYIDVETASDTSSESSGEESMQTSDNDSDDHGEQVSDTSTVDTSDDDDNIDPRLIFASVPCDDTEEPARAPKAGLLPRQRWLRNYGPNAYILRIVSMDQFGCEPFKRRQMDACPHCGYRFDGQDPDPSSLYARDIQRAVQVAREQISAMQEVIELP